MSSIVMCHLWPEECLGDDRQCKEKDEARIKLVFMLKIWSNHEFLFIKHEIASSRGGQIRIFSMKEDGQDYRQST